MMFTEPFTLKQCPWSAADVLINFFSLILWITQPITLFRKSVEAAAEKIVTNEPESLPKVELCELIDGL